MLLCNEVVTGNQGIGVNLAYRNYACNVDWVLHQREWSGKEAESISNWIVNKTI